MVSSIDTYEAYLDFIEKNFINKYFTIQKNYLRCKKGCAYCCKTGQYPLSEIEFIYLLIGYNKLSKNIKDTILKRIAGIKKEHNRQTGREYNYSCPFLIENVCCIYKYRPIICRTHGLIYFSTDKNGKERYILPECVHLGLNYSNVYDEKTSEISMQNWAKSGIKEEPLAYNISRESLMTNKVAETLEIDFGKDEALIDFFH